ncbi:MAG: hypothetical protein DWH93_01305 [Planctomycetota bacterium]|nr:MAG: hypothetical protein DWH93_01305 [Planctomycetota bacterium]
MQARLHAACTPTERLLRCSAWSLELLRLSLAAFAERHASRAQDQDPSSTAERWLAAQHGAEVAPGFAERHRRWLREQAAPRP